jgi:hypothetical protein
MKDPSITFPETFTDAAGTERLAGPPYHPVFLEEAVPTEVDLEVPAASAPIVGSYPRPEALLDPILAPDGPDSPDVVQEPDAAQHATVAAPQPSVGSSIPAVVPPLAPTGA